MPDESSVIVVGGGQSGLVAGYYLAKAGIPYIILDAGSRVGESWRTRWDGLRLFTIAQYCALPGLEFPADKNYFPTKDEMADYVESYASHFNLNVQLNTRVTLLEPFEGGYRLETSTGEVYHAPQVIVSTGAYQHPYTPPVAKDLCADVFQVHTHHYTNPDQLRGDNIVVVGAANSGAQIAKEIAQSGRTVVLSQGSGLPTFPCTFLGKGLHWYGDKLGLIKKPLIGPRDRAHRKTILIGDSLKKLSKKHGVRLVGRAIGAHEKVVLFEDRRWTETDSVVWATGFRPHYPWIDLPMPLNEAGAPENRRGVTEFPGLYFLGMQCQYSYGSALIWWVKDDAQYLVEQVQQARRELRPMAVA